MHPDARRGPGTCKAKFLKTSTFATDHAEQTLKHGGIVRNDNLQFDVRYLIMVSAWKGTVSAGPPLAVTSCGIKTFRTAGWMFVGRSHAATSDLVIPELTRRVIVGQCRPLPEQ